MARARPDRGPAVNGTVLARGPVPFPDGVRRRKARPASGPCVVTGVLEVKSARDGRLDVVVVAAGSGERVPIEYPPRLAGVVREHVLRAVIGGGQLFRSGEVRVLRLEWLSVAGQDVSSRPPGP